MQVNSIKVCRMPGKTELIPGGIFATLNDLLQCEKYKLPERGYVIHNGIRITDFSQKIAQNDRVLICKKDLAD